MVQFLGATSDPDPKTHLSICVNITTPQSFSDHTAEIKVGEHPFVKHKSVVNYADAKKLDMEKVESLVNQTVKDFIAQPSKPCSSQLLDKIRQGAIQSKRTPKGIKKECEEKWGKK